ncbi:MAG: hypothetical protein O7D35_07680 [Acidobacteria bacterium]|nr:hypothetical protein [Acidobacteriota bacterium]
MRARYSSFSGYPRDPAAGAVALAVGLTLIGLILWSMLFDNI